MVLAIARACEANEGDWRDRWQAVRAALAVTQIESAPTADPMSASVRPLDKADPTRVGPFQLVGVLGTGVMGRVYLGHSPTGRVAAVTVVHPELADEPGFRAQFQRKVAAARRVHSQFVAPIVDTDLDAARPWLAHAHVPGPSLQEAVHVRGPMPVASVWKMTAGLAEALHAVHTAGILHGGLSPADVLLAEDGPKLIGFGIASPSNGIQVTTGTAGFMTPEQSEGRSVTAAADVFALGAVLAFAVTGRPPFGDVPASAVPYRIVHETPDIASITDADLRALIGECLTKDPDHRPDTPDIQRRATLYRNLAEGQPADQGKGPMPWDRDRDPTLHIGF